MSDTTDTGLSQASLERTDHVHVADLSEHGAHPQDALYVKVAVILAAITAVEVAVSYLKRLGAGGPPVLIILAAIKFSMVAAYFMHLKMDHLWLRRLFVGGIILAIGIYVAVFLMFGVFQNRIHA